MTNLKWTRKIPESAFNFDLVLENPSEIDSAGLQNLVDSVLAESHRGITLSDRASFELRRWLADPSSPLKSAAIVLLSNWFMTRSGDRHSVLAGKCEQLWDALFSCRPPARLSSSEPGRNHLAVAAEFEKFLRDLSGSQGAGTQNEGGLDNCPEAPTLGLRPNTQDEETQSEKEELNSVLDIKGVHCEVKGSPRAVARFLKFMSELDMSVVL